MPAIRKRVGVATVILLMQLSSISSAQVRLRRTVSEWLDLAPYEGKTESWHWRVHFLYTALQISFDYVTEQTAMDYHRSAASLRGADSCPSGPFCLAAFLEQCMVTGTEWSFTYSRKKSHTGFPMLRRIDFLATSFLNSQLRFQRVASTSDVVSVAISVTTRVSYFRVWTVVREYSGQRSS